MGAIDIFEDKLADLTAICESRPHLTKLVHKAFILVDEREPFSLTIKSADSQDEDNEGLEDPWRLELTTRLCSS